MAAEDYAIVRLSPRRWALAKRTRRQLRKIVGYGSAERRPGGVLGRDLKDPMVLDGWDEWEPVDGLRGLTYEVALRAYYDAIHGRLA